MMDKCQTLADFIIVTEPLLSRETANKILTVTEGIEWRAPKDYGDYNRTCTTFPVSSAAVGRYPIPENKLDLVKWADETLLSIVQKALRLYKQKYPRVYTKSDEGFDILRYETGQFIGDHIDDRVPRVLTMSIALNDDYTGGEFKFWKEQVVPLPFGCAIIFPPNFMFPHEILPVISGTRYSMITWFI